MSSSNRKLQSLFPLPSNLRPAGSKKRFSQKRRTNPDDDDDYFDDDVSDRTQYRPAPDDNEEDPLDAYMSSIAVEAKVDLVNSGRSAKKSLVRQDIEDEDEQESFFRWLEENPDQGVSLVDEDEDDLVGEDRRFIEPLAKIDHALVDYADFEKNFYCEHSDIAELTDDKVAELRLKLNLSCVGYNVPRPAASFAHFGFDDQLMNAIARARFSQPTSIQSQAIPAILSGRDVIGIAETGSGKTCAYVWPALIHIMNQPDLSEGEGPIALICAPTRELAQQIHVECKRYGRIYNIESGCVYGGAGLHQQMLMLKSPVSREILVCTPGRLIDLIAKKKALSLRRVTYLVFDEADRMFEMGFEPQVRSIADNVRPDRQCLLFSATFRPKIEKLARDILNGELVRISHGKPSISANANIEQKVIVFAEPGQKYEWLLGNIVRFISDGKLLVFVGKKENCGVLAKNLSEHIIDGGRIGFIHGDVSQFERNESLRRFRAPLTDETRYDVLVATDVASRGLDIRGVKTVINYDPAKDVETHIHRIGRTARAGEKGNAYTLLCRERDREFAPHLVRNLEQSDQVVSQELLGLAMENGWFSRSRRNSSTKTPPKKTKTGLGYKDKPEAVGPMSHYRGVRAKGSHIGGGGDGGKLDNNALRKSYHSQFATSFVKATEPQTSLSLSSVAVPDNATRKRSSRGDGRNEGEKRSRWS